MECQLVLDQIKQLQQEGFTEEMIRQLLPKLEEVAVLKEEERKSRSVVNEMVVCFV